MLTTDELEKLRGSSEEMQRLKHERYKHALERRRQGATLAEIGAELGVSGGRAGQIVHKAQREIELAEKRGGHDLPLSVRCINCLAHIGVPSDSNGIPSAEWLAKNMTQRHLLGVTNFGRKSLNELIEWMSGQGYRLAKDDFDITSPTPKFAAKAVRQALKDYPPENGETFEAWLRRLENQA